MKDNSKSKILLDTFNQKIKFVDINEELKVSKSEKALYVLILAESLSGGANFNPPANPKYQELYKTRVKRLTRKFAKIYHMFGGAAENAPDILENYELHYYRSDFLNSGVEFENKFYRKEKHWEQDNTFGFRLRDLCGGCVSEYDTMNGMGSFSSVTPCPSRL